MKKSLVIGAIASSVLVMGATVVGYQDWQLRASTPSNPASGYLRVWADTATGKFKCLTSTGAACYFDSLASNGPTLQTGGVNNGSQTALNLVAGTNVTLSNSGANVTINSSGSGGGSGGTTIWSGAGSPNGSDVAPHNMTGSTSPVPYSVTSSLESGFGVQAGYQAFNGPIAGCVNYNSVCSGWGTGNNHSFPQWLELDLGSGNTATIGSFSMVGSNLDPYLDSFYGAVAEPRDFTLQGSNDNSTWNIVSTQTNVTWAFTSQVQNFLCSVTSTAYRYWLVNITATSGGTAAGFIGQLYLYAAGLTSGAAGDFYYRTDTNQWYGPRPSGGSPIWPLVPNADANLSFTDVATGNVSTTAHGFAPKLPNDATKFLNGVGAYSAPPGGTTIISGNGNPNGVGAQFSPANMTSNSAPSPIVVSTTVGDFNGQGGWVVFSPTGSQYVTGAGAPQSLTLDLGAGAAFVLGSYRILNASSGTAYAPIAWSMAGSNDGSTFTTVDTQSGQSFTGGVYNPYTPTTTTTSYRYFRINITSAAGGGSWGMTALQLFAFATPVTSGSAGDWYFETSTKQLYGPRPSGAGPVWPLLGTLN